MLAETIKELSPLTRTVVAQYGTSLSPGAVTKALRVASPSMMEQLEKSKNVMSAMSGISQNVSKKIMTEVATDGVSIPFINIILPLLKDRLPDEVNNVMELLTSKAGKPVLRMLNAAYLHGGVNEHIIKTTLLSPKNTREFTRLANQYKEHGAAAVDWGALVQIAYTTSSRKYQKLMPIARSIASSKKVDGLTILKALTSISSDQDAIKTKDVDKFNFDNLRQRIKDRRNGRRATAAEDLQQLITPTTPPSSDGEGV
jgi:hypothetical protein